MYPEQQPQIHLQMPRVSSHLAQKSCSIILIEENLLGKEDLKKEKGISCSWVRKFNVVKMTALLKVI